MSLAARIGRAILWGQAGRLMEAAILFSFSLLLARVLGPAGYGLYALGISLAGIFGFLSVLGLGPETLGRFLPEITSDGQQHRAKQLLRALLGIRGAAILIVACVAFGLRDAISGSLHSPLIGATLAAVLAVFAGRSILDLLTYFSSGLLELRRVAVAKLAAAAIAPGLFVLLVVFHLAGVKAAWLSIAAGSLVGVSILALPFFSTRTTTETKEQLPLRQIFAFGIFTWVTNLFVYILGDGTDVLLLGWLLPDRAAIGCYAMGARIVFSLTTLLLGWVPLMCVASLSEVHRRSRIEGVARTVETQWRLAAFCIVGPCLLLVRYAPEIINNIYSARYGASVPVTQTLSILMACSVIAGFSLGTSALYAIGRERLACLLVGIAAVFNILTEIILVRRIGILGAACATGFSMLFLAVLATAAARHSVPFRFPGAFIAKIVIAACFGLVPTFCLTAHSVATLILGSLVWGTSFLLGLFVLKPLERLDSEALAHLSPRLASIAEPFSMRRLSVATGGIPWQE